MSSSDLQQLNTFQHFVCKNALELPKLCRSDISESLFNVQPISAEIDTRKLLFLGRLCRLDYDALPKKIFLTRLTSFMLEYLQDWLYNGTFPTKDSWKKIVRRAVKSSHDRDRERRMSYDPDFSFFREVFSKFRPSSIWKLPSTPNEINLCKSIVKLCTKMHCNYN